MRVIFLLFCRVSVAFATGLPGHVMQNLSQGNAILQSYGIQTSATPVYSSGQVMMEGPVAVRPKASDRYKPLPFHPDFHAAITWVPPITESSEGYLWHSDYHRLATSVRVQVPYKWKNPSQSVFGQWLPTVEIAKAIKDNVSFLFYWRKQLQTRCAGKGYEAFQEFGKLIDEIVKALADGYPEPGKAFAGERKDKEYVLDGKRIGSMYNVAYQFLLEIYDRVSVPDQFAVPANQLLLSLVKLIHLHGGRLPEDPRSPTTTVYVPKFASPQVAKENPSLKPYSSQTDKEGRLLWSTFANDIYHYINEGQQMFCVVPIPEKPADPQQPKPKKEPTVVSLDKVQFQIVIPPSEQ